MTAEVTISNTSESKAIDGVILTSVHVREKKLWERNNTQWLDENKAMDTY